MKTNRIAAFAAIALSMLAFGACKQKENTEPEKPVVVATVLFSAENGDYCYYVGEGGSKTIELAVIREESESADSYTVKVNNATAGLVIPEAVEFAAGAKQSTLKINAPESVKAGEKYDFDIQLTGKNVNTSASSTDGTLRCEGTIYAYEEVYARGSFDNDKGSHKYLGYFKQKVWKLADNKMILKDFLKSGNDLTITYSPEFTQYYGYDILDVACSDPSYEYRFADDENAGCNYLYFYKAISDTEGEYQSFYPKGEQRYIYKMSLYWGQTYSCYYKTEKYDYLYFTVPMVSFYSESENVDKTYTWMYYMYIDFASDEEMAATDFTGFPELPAPSSTRQLTFSIYDWDAAKYTYTFDAQDAEVTATETGTDFTIQNFFLTGTPMVFHTTKDSYALTFECGSSYYYEDSFYFTDSAGQYMWLYPFSTDTSKAMNMYFYSTKNTSYCGWDETSGYAYIPVSTKFYGDADWASGTLYVQW